MIILTPNLRECAPIVDHLEIRTLGAEMVLSLIFGSGDLTKGLLACKLYLSI